MLETILVDLVDLDNTDSLLCLIDHTLQIFSSSQ